MRRRLAWLGALAFGCSTDVFVGSDASSDASVDVVVDAAADAPLDVGVDSGDGGAKACPFSHLACGAMSGPCGTLGQCCATPDAGVCMASTQSCKGGAASFLCMTPGDCALGTPCCLAATTATAANGCPIITDLNPSSACFTCSGVGHHHVCASDSDCNGPATCRELVYGGLSFGVCL